MKYQDDFMGEFNKADLLNAANWKALENIRDFL